MGCSNGFTATEQNLLKVLSDGLPHSRRELYACVGDGVSTSKHVKIYISMLRRKLLVSGQDIVCELRSEGTYYRMCALLDPQRFTSVKTS